MRNNNANWASLLCCLHCRCAMLLAAQAMHTTDATPKNWINDRYLKTSLDSNKPCSWQCSYTLHVVYGWVYLTGCSYTMRCWQQHSHKLQVVGLPSATSPLIGHLSPPIPTKTPGSAHINREITTNALDSSYSIGLRVQLQRRRSVPEHTAYYAHFAGTLQ